MSHVARVPDATPVEAPEDSDSPVSSFLANAFLLRRFVLISLALAIALALSEAGRRFLETGSIWTSWALVPFGVLLLLFPCNFLIQTLYHSLKNIPVLRGEQALRTTTFANRPVENCSGVWPSVTVMIPVFTEPFETVIRPTIDSARRAAERYTEQTGAAANVLVCEDGLQYLADNRLGELIERARSKDQSLDETEVEAANRIDYYERHGVVWVARPRPIPDRPETARPGRFPKASNLNYALRFCVHRTSVKSGSEGTEKPRLLGSDPDPEFSLTCSGGTVELGEIILQLDKDSIVHPDVIWKTVPEFQTDPALAYTQHSTYPTNEGRYFSLMIGWFTRALYELAIRGKCLVPGTFVPLMGHNFFLRTETLFRVGGWHEDSVCEDLQLMMEIHQGGQHGRYIAYPGLDFGEAVTRTHSEESEKFRRYAFGAAEAVLNPLGRWERDGIFKASWRAFCRSPHTRWYQVADLLQFFFSMINLATIIPLSLLTALGLAYPTTALSVCVMAWSIFFLSVLPAHWLLRRRGGIAAMPAARSWRGRAAPLKAVLALFGLGFAFLGYSLPVLRGGLGYLAGRPIRFGATEAAELGHLSRWAHWISPALRRARREAVALLTVSGVFLAYRMTSGDPFGWMHLAWFFPIAVHALIPFLFHPYLVGGPDWGEISHNAPDVHPPAYATEPVS